MDASTTSAMDASTSEGQKALLDHRFYPHIVDSILDQSAWTTLATWRQTCKKYRDRAEAIMFHHIVITAREEGVKPESSANVTTVSGWATHVRIRATRGRPLPHCPWKGAENGRDPLFENSRRMLAKARVVDWEVLGLHGAGDHHHYTLPELGLLDHFLTKLVAVRRRNGSLCDLRAATYFDFVYLTSAFGFPGASWAGQNAKLTPESFISYARATSVRDVRIVFSKTRDERSPVRPLRQEDGGPLGVVGDLIHAVAPVVWKGGKLVLVGLENIPASALWIHSELAEQERTAMVRLLIRDIVRDWPRKIMENWPDAYLPPDRSPCTPDRLESALSNIELWTCEQHASSNDPDYHFTVHPPNFFPIGAGAARYRWDRTKPWRDDMEQSEEAEEYEDSDTEYIYKADEPWPLETILWSPVD